MLDLLYEFGINLILALQGLGEWLASPMNLVSWLGAEEFYLLLAPALYWSVNAALGLRVGLILMLSTASNAALKLAFRQPRPFWYDTRVQAFSIETTFGIPSGHSQNAFAFWGMLAAGVQRAWAKTGAAALIVLIGISRLYLGMHFVTDVLFGWLVGGALLWAFLRFERPALRWLEKRELGDRILTVLGCSLALVLIPATIRMALGSYVLPDIWAANAAPWFSPEEPFDPLSPLALDGAISSAGVFFGLAAGALAIQSQGGFRADGSLWQRTLRYLLGVIGVVLIWRGLGIVFPSGEFLLAYFLRYLRYSLIGLWISWWAPLIFLRLGIAHTGSKPLSPLTEGAPTRF